MKNVRNLPVFLLVFLAICLGSFYGCEKDGTTPSLSVLEQTDKEQLIRSLSEDEDFFQFVKGYLKIVEKLENLPLSKITGIMHLLDTPTKIDDNDSQEILTLLGFSGEREAYAYLQKSAELSNRVILRYPTLAHSTDAYRQEIFTGALSLSRRFNEEILGIDIKTLRPITSSRNTTFFTTIVSCNYTPTILTKPGQQQPSPYQICSNWSKCKELFEADAAIALSQAKLGILSCIGAGVKTTLGGLAAGLGVGTLAGAPPVGASIGFVAGYYSGVFSALYCIDITKQQLKDGTCKKAQLAAKACCGL